MQRTTALSEYSLKTINIETLRKTPEEKREEALILTHIEYLLHKAILDIAGSLKKFCPKIKLPLNHEILIKTKIRLDNSETQHPININEYIYYDRQLIFSMVEDLLNRMKNIFREENFGESLKIIKAGVYIETIYNAVKGRRHHFQLVNFIKNFPPEDFHILNIQKSNITEKDNDHNYLDVIILENAPFIKNIYVMLYYYKYLNYLINKIKNVPSYDIPQKKLHDIEKLTLILEKILHDYVYIISSLKNQWVSEKNYRIAKGKKTIFILELDIARLLNLLEDHSKQMHKVPHDISTLINYLKIKISNNK